nr:equilibrative nucleoside transporter 1-like isoform X2 [Procambarus clarkii]
MEVQESTNKKTPVVVVATFYMLGVVTLLPWNFFINAETYWQYKLRNVSLGEDWESPDADLTPLQLSFTPTLVIVSNSFCTIFLIVTSAIVRRVGEGVRLVGSLAVSLAAMLVITFLTLVDTDTLFTAVLQGSSYGLAGVFPSTCINSMNSGQAIAGVFSSLARILSLLVGQEPVSCGLIFFGIADCFLLLSIVDYIYLTKTDYYSEVKNECRSRSKEQEESGGQPRDRSDWVFYLAVFKKLWLMGATYGGTLFVSLMIFPAVTVYVTSTLPESRWTEVFFQPTITFLLFNLGDWLGREAPRWVPWPGPRGWTLHVFGACRLVLLPLLMLCHGTNKTFPTVFNNDAYYIVFLFLLAFTNGHISTLALIYYPSLVDADELEVGGAIMAAMLGVGMVVGSLLSPALVALWGPQ